MCLDEDKMLDIYVAVICSKEIEKKLRENFDIQGYGLGILVNSIDSKSLPATLRKKLLMIASMRNQVVHGESDKLSNRQLFADLCNEVTSSLSNLKKKK